MNPFAERYKTLNNADLVRIVTDTNNYQPIAIEAARSELANRQVTDAEISILKAEIELQKDKRIAKKASLKKKVNNVLSSVDEAVNPINKVPSVNRTILITTIVFALLSIYGILYQFSFIRFVLFSDKERWSVETILYLASVFMPLVGVWLFWRRKKVGWILLLIFILYSLITNVWLMIKLSKYRGHISPLNQFFPSISPEEVITLVIFFGVYTYTFLKKDVRSIYNVNRPTWALTIALGIIWTWILNTALL